QRPVPGRPFGERGGDDGQPGRRGEGRRHPLDQPGGDEQRAGADQPAEQRGHGEDGERGQEDAAPAEQVGGAAAEQQQPAVTEHVPAHHPLQRRGGQPQVGPDGRQRDADHGDVERIQEQGTAQHHEQAPQARTPAAGELGEGRGWVHGQNYMHAQAVVANTISALATNFALDYTPAVTQQQAAAGLVDEGLAPAEDPALAEDAAPAEDAALAEDAAPAEDAVLAEDAAPADEAGLAEEPAPAGEPRPAEEPGRAGAAPDPAGAGGRA